MPAKKKAEPKEEPKVTVDGFQIVEYEGMDLLVCDRGDFDTFDLGSAKAHLKEHARMDTDIAQLAELTEHLSDHAQVTTTEEPDEG